MPHPFESRCPRNLKSTKYKSEASALTKYRLVSDDLVFAVMRNPIVLTLLGYCNFAGVFAANVQLPGLRLPPGSQTHQNAVKNIFLTSYDAYKWVYALP